METISQDKAWAAKIVGSCYFILLGFVYAVIELVTGRFSLTDIGVLAWVCLPLLINRRWLYFLFSGVNLLVWCYLAFHILIDKPGETLTLMVFLTLSLGSVIAALMLIYSAVNIPEKKFDLL